MYLWTSFIKLFFSFVSFNKGVIMTYHFILQEQKSLWHFTVEIHTNIQTWNETFEPQWLIQIVISCEDLNDFLKQFTEYSPCQNSIITKHCVECNEHLCCVLFFISTHNFEEEGHQRLIHNCTNFIDLCDPLKQHN